MSFSFAVSAKTMNVAFVGHTKGDNAFWDNLLAPMPEVAKQLGINLTVYHANYNNRFSYFDIVEEIVNGDNPPDVLISPFRAASSKPLLRLIEKKKIPFISIVNEIPRSERNTVGKPQENYKYWKASVTSDDFKSGELLAQKLLSIAETKTDKRPLPFVALAGDHVLESSLKRNDGLKNFISKSSDFYYQQMVFTDWNTVKAYRMCVELFFRHGQPSIIWAANDDIALTAHRCMTDLSVELLPAITIGGVDATNKGIKAVLEGKLDVTLGGNQMHGAWALIVAFDMFNGKTQHELTLDSPFFVVDKHNANALLELLNDSWHKIDFKSMSKSYNPELIHYDFNLSHYLTYDKVQ